MSRLRQSPPSGLHSSPKPVVSGASLPRSNSATLSQGRREERAGTRVEDPRLPSSRPQTSLPGVLRKKDYTKRSIVMLDESPSKRPKSSTCGEGPNGGETERSREAGGRVGGGSVRGRGVERARGGGRTPGMRDTARGYEPARQNREDREDNDEPPGFKGRGEGAQHASSPGVNGGGPEGSGRRPRLIVTMRKSAPPKNNSVLERAAPSEQNTSEEDLEDLEMGNRYLFRAGGTDDEREEDRGEERRAEASEAAPMEDREEEGGGGQEEYIKVVEFLKGPIFDDPSDGTKVVVDRVCLREGLEPVFAVHTALQHYQVLLPLFETHENERVANNGSGSARPDLKTLKCMTDNQLCANTTPRIGTVMGVGVGSTFSKKTQLQVVGLHFGPMRGIYFSAFLEYGGAKIALAVVNKVGEYGGEAPPNPPLPAALFAAVPLTHVPCPSMSTVGDRDTGEELRYVGEGGGDGKNNVKSQTMTGGNLALKNSCALSAPVRVIRGHNEGYSYDGLYHVKEWWEEEHEHDLKKVSIFVFHLVREPGQGDVPKPVTGDRLNKPKLKKNLLKAA